MKTRRILLILGVCALLALALATLARSADGPAQASRSIAGSSTATPTSAQVPGIPAEAFQGTSGADDRMIPQMEDRADAPLPTAEPAGRGPFAPRAVLGGSDVLVNGDSALQNETTLAVRGNTICAGYNDSGVGGITGFSRSPDLGATWIDRGGMGQGSDPVLAVHQATGTFYYAEIAFLGGASAIGVARSTDDCNSFPTLANASPATSAPPDFQDKPWIAVDNTGGPRDGYVYVCWTRFVDTFPGPSTSGEILISRSTDGGITFGAEQVISPPTDNFPFGCHIDVGPNGEVYVAWADRNFFADFPIRFRRSLDGGLTWEPTVQVSTAPVRLPGFDRIIVCGGGVRPSLNGDIRMLHQAHLAVDTTGGSFDGNIYIVWASDPVGVPDNSDVYFSRSTDGGLTWTNEVQIAGSIGTDQFQPYVEVGGQGAVSVAWYDRRNDPVDNFDIDVYTTFSSDGGASLVPISRLTDVSFPVPPINGQPGNFDPAIATCYMGEYIAIAADASSFYYAWGDNRNTVVSSNYPSGRPDPNVFFDRQSVVVDSDADGCTDKVELQAKSEAATGGGRDPNYYWDFMDMWVNKQKDRRVNVIDIGAMVQRIFTSGDPGGDPLDPPQALAGYHVSADRSPPIGPDLWNAGPPDGDINIIEIGLAVAQFSYDCS